MKLKIQDHRNQSCVVLIPNICREQCKETDGYDFFLQRYAAWDLLGKVDFVMSWRNQLRVNLGQPETSFCWKNWIFLTLSGSLELQQQKKEEKKATTIELQHRETSLFI